MGESCGRHRAEFSSNTICKISFVFRIGRGTVQVMKIALDISALTHARFWSVKMRIAILAAATFIALC